MVNHEMNMMGKKAMVKPAGITRKATLIILPVCLAVLLSACGGSKLIKNSEPIELTTPLAQISDRQVTATLQWVIVRDGPGTWAKYASWDEYLLGVKNQSGEKIQLTGIYIVDSMGFQHPSDSNRRRLVKASRGTIKRYKNIDIDINAGYGGGAALIAAGVGAGYLASAALNVAVEAALMSGATATGTMAVAASAAFVVAPILIVGGIAQGINNHKVTNEIVARHTALPVIVAANETLWLDLFFPLAPSPQRIDIAYSGPFGERVISLDTNEVLNGLHIVSPKIYEEDLPETF
jgi:hypothetical protein